VRIWKISIKPSCLTGIVEKSTWRYKMNRKMALAGILVAVLVFSSLGVIVMAQEATDEAAVDQDTLDETTIEDGQASENDDTIDTKFLITREQMETIRGTIQYMQENHSTRTEIREMERTMTMEYAALNLGTYGLTESEITEIQAKMTELWAKEDDTAALANELWAQDMNMMDIQDALQKMRNETQNLRLELATMLGQYGILMPGPGHEGPGQGGRMGSDGQMGGMPPGRPMRPEGGMNNGNGPMDGMPPMEGGGDCPNRP
jgi:hypothetical protein